MNVRKFAARSRWRTAVLGLAGLTALGGCTRSAEDDREAELVELRRQRLERVERFGIIQSAIRRTQAAALDAPAVRSAQAAFQDRLMAYARTHDPETVPLLERSAELGADYDRMSGQQPVMTDQPVTADEQIAVAGEIQSLERALRPFLQRAMTDPAVREAFLALQSGLVEEMTRLDANVPVTLERLEEKAGEIREIDRRIAELESATSD